MPRKPKRTHAEKLALAVELLAEGYTPQAAAKRLGLTVGAVNGALRAARSTARAQEPAREEEPPTLADQMLEVLTVDQDWLDELLRPDFPEE